MARCRKIQTGRSVQLCTESVGRPLLFSDDGLAEADNNTAERALRAAVSERKILMTFVKY